MSKTPKKGLVNSIVVIKVLTTDLSAIKEFSMIKKLETNKMFTLQNNHIIFAVQVHSQSLAL